MQECKKLEYRMKILEDFSILDMSLGHTLQKKF